MPRPADPHAREQLLRAARAEFARHGLDRARIEDIARAAKLSKGAFYLHFESKEDVLRELIVRLTAVLEELTARRSELEAEWFHTHGPVPRDPVKAGEFVEAFIAMECTLDVELLETFWRNREVLAAINGAPGESWAEIVQDFRRRMREQLTGDFARQQRLGLMRTDVDRDALIDVVSGAYEALILRLPSMTRKPDLAGWARGVTSVLLQGILPVRKAESTSAARPPRAIRARR